MSCMKAPKTATLRKVAVYWKQGFAIMSRDGWLKVDLNTGDTEPLPYPKHAFGHGGRCADGTMLVGSGGGNKLYTYSLPEGIERQLPFTGHNPM